VSLNDMS